MVLHEAGRRLMTPTTTSLLDRRSDGQDSSANQFEFLTSSSDEVCTADDVIVGGRLLPFVAPPPPQPKKPQTRIPGISIGSDLRRSISLDDPHPKTKRNETHIHRSSSLGDPPRGGKITGDHRKLKNPCILALGRPARVPAAMELKEIRSRQRRRGPASTERKEAAEKHAGGERRPWKLLETLSCRAMDAVVIA